MMRILGNLLLFFLVVAGIYIIGRVAFDATNWFAHAINNCKQDKKSAIYARIIVGLLILAVLCFLFYIDVFYID